MSKEERYLLQRIVNWWDDDHEGVVRFIEEIRAYLAEPEKKRGPLSEEEIMQISRKECEAFRWPSSAIFIARAVEKHHGIGGEDE